MRGVFHTTRPPATCTKRPACPTRPAIRASSRADRAELRPAAWRQHPVCTPSCPPMDSDRVPHPGPYPGATQCPPAPDTLNSRGSSPCRPGSELPPWGGPRRRPIRGATTSDPFPNRSRHRPIRPRHQDRGQAPPCAPPATHPRILVRQARARPCPPLLVLRALRPISPARAAKRTPAQHRIQTIRPTPRAKQLQTLQRQRQRRPANRWRRAGSSAAPRRRGVIRLTRPSPRPHTRVPSVAACFGPPPPTAVGTTSLPREITTILPTRPTCGSPTPKTFSGLLIIKACDFLRPCVTKPCSAASSTPSRVNWSV